MVKKLIYGGVFAVVVFGLLAAIVLKRFDKTETLDVWQAVPGDAIVFVEGLDYDFLVGPFFNENRIWIDFVNTTEHMKLDSLIKLGLTGLEKAPALREFLTDEGFHVSLHLLGKQQIAPVFYLSYGGTFSDNDFSQLMQDYLEAESMVNARKYEGIHIFDVSGRPGFVPGKFTFSCRNGICILSASSLLVEEAVRQVHAGDGRQENPGLERIKATAGRYVHANVYLNYALLNQLFSPFLSQPNNRVFGRATRLASWGELDLDVKSDAILFNGMSLAADDEDVFLRVLQNQDPVRMEIHQVMPSGTSSFLHLGISNKSAFKEDLIELLTIREEWDKVALVQEELKKEYGIDPLNDLLNLMDDELAWISIEGLTTKRADEVLLIETLSESETRETVQRWLRLYLEKHKFDMQSYRQVYHLDKETSFPIYRLPEFFKETAANRLFGDCFTVYGNNLIFGPSVEVLSRVLYQNVLHKTIVSDQAFKEMSDYLANRNNLSFFFRPFAFLGYIRPFLNEAGKKAMEQAELFLRRMPGVVLQYTNEGELFYQNVACKYTFQINEKALTAWESLLDTSVFMKPVLVQNHLTGEKEIFVQDASNKIYLINSTGRILWSQYVDGPVMGEVYQVDFYKNRKLQLLFNTRDKIHLIDRNGNYVERYPIAMRVPATNPIALFDYDKSRDYRICVAAEDRRIYLYDIEGNIVSGWKFGKTESTVSQVLQHFRIQTRDYILARDDRRIYILDRRGKERIRPARRFVVSPNNAFTLDMNVAEARPRWITTDTAGNVLAIYLDGSLTTLLKQKAGPDHFFQMEDLDRDGVPEFILTEDQEMQVLKQNGQPFCSFKVREGIDDRPDIYKFSSSDTKIGITDRSRNRIYLVNADGSLYEGFPLEGSTRFSIGYFAGSDSRFNLIVGSNNNFLYNYSIE